MQLLLNFRIAKQELAISKFESSIELMTLSDCDLTALGPGYHSRKTADGFLASINDCVSADVYKEITDLGFLSVSCDETTDILIRQIDCVRNGC